MTPLEARDAIARRLLWVTDPAEIVRLCLVANALVTGHEGPPPCPTCSAPMHLEQERPGGGVFRLVFRCNVYWLAVSGQVDSCNTGQTPPAAIQRYIDAHGWNSAAELRARLAVA